MKRLVLFPLIAVALLLAAGCSSKEKDAQIGSQATKITQLQDSLSKQANQLYEKDVRFNQNARDLALLAQELTTLEGKNQALTGQLKKANKKVTVATSAFTSMSAAHDSVETYASQLANDKTNLINELAQCGEEKKVMQGNQNRYVEEIGLIAPWYNKWRHDATERNFIEKLFGADKAERTNFPEPSVHL